MRRTWLLALLVPSTALACGWDYETLRAEKTSLPCLSAVVNGVFPQHVKKFYEKRIVAADGVLLWVPGELNALDSKAIALMHLKRFDDALAVLAIRARLEPDSYATRANLSTVLTLKGEFAKALPLVDSILAADPNAHFGREQFHRRFLAQLIADPTGGDADFLGLPLTGTAPPTKKPDALPADAMEAVVAMISVYGAGESPHLYAALGNLAHVNGLKRHAWAAYATAIKFKHPKSAVLKTWAALLQSQIAAEHPRDPRLGDRPGGLKSLAESMAIDSWSRRANEYREWETKLIDSGLPSWTPEAAELLITRQEAMGLRCASPGLSDVAGAPTTRAIPVDAGAPPLRFAELETALRGALAAVHETGGECGAVQEALGAFFTAHRADLKSSDEVARYASKHAGVQHTLQLLTTVRARCPGAFDLIKR